MAMLRRITNLFRRSRINREIEDELRSHLEMRVEDNIATGMTREEAPRDARLRFGNPVMMRERVAGADAALSLDSIWRDIRYASRQLRRSPGFAIVALLTLAMGIGANAGIFTLLDAVLLKSLPVPHPEQLFLIKQSDHAAEKSRFPYPFFARVRQQLPDNAAIAAMGWPDDFYVNAGNQAGNQQPERAMGQLVSGNYFQVFETWPVLGRLLTPGDDVKLGGAGVAVISYGYWQQRFGGDPAVIGRGMTVNGVPFTIVGVAAGGFFGARAGAEPDFWMPLMMQADVRYHDHYSDIAGEPLKPWVPQENIRWLQFVVRVRDSSALPLLTTVLNQQYRHDLELLAPYLRDPDQRESMLRIHLTLEPGQRGFANLRQEFAQPLLLLMGMAAMVLLIACANIANLLLARAAARRRALAVQLSMGASRTRLMRQILTECLLLSGCGGVLGIAVAFWCTRVLPRWASAGNVAIPLHLVPDARVLLFSVLVTMATGLLFGLAPALQSAHIDPASVLKASAQSIAGQEGRWSLRKVLVAAQVALSLVLLVGAGMFLRTLENYSRLDPGFDRDHLLSVHLDTHLVDYQTADFPSLYERLIDQMEAIPGVRSADVATCSLVSGCFDSSDVILTGDDGRKNAPVNAQVNSVSLHYFATVGIGLLRGRGFATTDNAAARKVALVNQTFASRYVGAGDPTGRRFTYADSGSESYEIVGVVADARVNDVREAAPPVIYFPIAQAPGNIDGLEIRTQAAPQWIATQARQAVAAVDHRIPVVNVATLSEEVNDNLSQQRLIARLTSIFGLLALGLACLGLYGVMSYIVQRRTSEIGVRLALGSSRSNVLWLVLKETFVLVSAGGLLGLVLSVAAMHLTASFLFGLSPEDPVTMGGAAVLLYLVSIAAGFFPARRAASINPVEALRAE
jgi:predicted permease